MLKAAFQRCSVKKVFLEILQNSQENTCASLFLNKVAGPRQNQFVSWLMTLTSSFYFFTYQSIVMKPCTSVNVLHLQEMAQPSIMLLR